MRGPAIKDLTGFKTLRLTVIKQEGYDNSRKTTWLCRCSCLKTVVVNVSNLKKGQKSCGCYRDELFETNRARKPGQIAQTKIIKWYKKNAFERGLAFNLTDSECSDLFRGLCNYCGVPPSNISKYRETSFRYNGIDRIDNTVGYVKANVVSCCKKCNMAKNNMPYADFVDWIRRLACHNFGD